MIYDEDTDPSNSRLLDVEGIVERDGLQVYKDQAGRLWTGLATYWIKRGEFERATATFEKGLAAVVTIRDFTQIFDAYAEFSETMISTLMDALADEDNLEDEDFDAEETEQELDERMKSFEELMDRRPFLVNDVLLRRNPNEVVEWEKRIALHGDDDAKVVEAYVKALDIINPRKATGPLYPCMSTLPSSMKKAEAKTTMESQRMSLIWSKRERSLSEQPRCRSSRSMNWQRFGASGPKWN